MVSYLTICGVLHVIEKFSDHESWVVNSNSGRSRYERRDIVGMDSNHSEIYWHTYSCMNEHLYKKMIFYLCNTNILFKNCWNWVFFFPHISATFYLICDNLEQI